ncbi:hypothetical protein Holit_01211 [Hollandina sp. SP2]
MILKILHRLMTLNKNIYYTSVIPLYSLIHSRLQMNRVAILIFLLYQYEEYIKMGKVIGISPGYPKKIIIG